MMPPDTETEHGFELQFGANHLGHYALTGLRLDHLLITPNARVANVSSSAHRIGSGTIEFDNLHAENGYSPSGAYAQSKLANLLFTLELNRLFEEVGADTAAVAAHRGWTVTGLQRGFLQAVTRHYLALIQSRYKLGRSMASLESFIACKLRQGEGLSES